jgi:carbonic anhydrase
VAAGGNQNSVIANCRGLADSPSDASSRTHEMFSLPGTLAYRPKPKDPLISMRELSHLFANNRAWADQIRTEDPEFFRKLCHQQAPRYFWIGCSDSRVPANQITGLLPGEMFVHRNVANVVPPNDLNCLSALAFAVDVLQVRHVIVCGHYGCAGVSAVLRGLRFDLVDQWLMHVEKVRRKHAAQLTSLGDEETRFARLCELNVIEQVAKVCETTCVQDAWTRGQPVMVHGWIYAVNDGLLRDLEICIAAPEELAPAYQAAIARGAPFIDAGQSGFRRVRGPGQL